MHEQRIRSNYRTSKTTYIILLQSSLVCAQMLLSHLQTFFFWAIHFTLFSLRGVSWDEKGHLCGNIDIQNKQLSNCIIQKLIHLLQGRALIQLLTKLVMLGLMPTLFHKTDGRSAGPRAQARHALVNCYVTIYRRASTC